MRYLYHQSTLQLKDKPSPIGSFLEFLPILSLMKQEYSPSDLPYHIVVPSLPGYAFSSTPPLDKNFGLGDVACVMDVLMTELGFGNGYIAQGGDIGSYVARVLGAEYEACKGVHRKSNLYIFIHLVVFIRGYIFKYSYDDISPVNFSIMAEPKGISPNSIDDLERQGLLRLNEFMTNGIGYAIEHKSRPSTIGLVLASSPLALLAW